MVEVRRGEPAAMPATGTELFSDAAVAAGAAPFPQDCEDLGGAR